MQRRQFFSAAAAMATPWSSDSILRAQATINGVSGRAADSVARDEDFWFNVRHAFTVDPNMINLNNGGVSPAPKIVMDTEVRYLEVENLNPSYYMWNVLDPGLETVRRQRPRLRPVPVQAGGSRLRLLRQLVAQVDSHSHRHRHAVHAQK